LVVAADAARTIDDLALAVVDNLGAPRPRSVVLFGLQTGGGARMLASHGVAARMAGDWLHVPSVMVTPANDATRRGRPVWLDGRQPHPYTLMGTAPRRAVLPLLDGDSCVGALEIAWDLPGEFDDTQRRFLSDAAGALGPRLRRTGDDEHASVPLLQAAIDSLLLPAQLLAPVRDEAGAPVDFVISYANAAAMNDPTAPFTLGRRLLDTDPGVLATGAFDAYVRALDSGEPMRTEPVEELTTDGHQRVRRSAVRLRDRLLVTWQILAAKETGGEQAERMEILGDFGWGEWSRDLAPIAWSPGLFRLLGRTPSRGALSLSRVLARVVPDDLAQADTMLRRTLHESREALVEFRLDREGDVRDLRVVAEPRLDHRGHPVAILALVQDVTQTKRRDRQLSRREEQLAAQRIHGAAEQAYTDELRRLLYPPAEHTRVNGRVTLRARHVAPKSIQQFRGDFYDIVEVPGGIVLTVGDVFGSGVGAATTMVRLRHAARALSLAGVDPAEILTLLNGELDSDEEPPLASLVVARFRQSDLSWAQAGHFAPALIRAGRTRSLNRPGGIALGLTKHARYDEARLALRESDVLVFYTDGVLSGLGPVVDPVSQLVRGFGVAHREGGPATLLDRYLRPAEDEACVVTVEIGP
jgi:PAS domain-containing protein